MSFRTTLSVIALGAGLCLPLAHEGLAQSTSSARAEKPLNTDRIDAFIKKYGNREQVAKSVEVIKQTSLFLQDEPKDDFAALRNTIGIMGKLAEMSDTPEGAAAGALMSMTQSLLPAAPDPVLFHLQQIEKAIDTMNNNMVTGFENISREIDLSSVDNKLFRYLTVIDGKYDVYLSHIETLKDAGDEPVYSGGITKITEDDLYGATGALAGLCDGSASIKGQNIFDAYLRYSDGDLMAMMRVGQVILHRIVNAQTVHTAHIFYSSPPELSAKAVKNAMEVASDKHAARFKVCEDAIDDRLRTMSNPSKRTLEPYVNALIQNTTGSLDARTIGTELKAHLPMHEWAVVSYEHAPRQGDKSKVNWVGDDYIKIRVPQDRSLDAKHHVIVSFFKRSDAGLADESSCEANIIAYNKRNERLRQSSLHHSSKRNYLPDLCPEISSTTRLAWASHRTGSTMWTSDPLSVKATAPNKRKNYSAQRIKYMIVGAIFKNCAGVQPDFKKIAGIGGGSSRAMFLTTGGYFGLYSKGRGDNCFVTRGKPFDSEFGVFTDDSKDTKALLDTTPFKDLDPQWEQNFLILGDGTYRAFSPYGNSGDPVQSGDLTDRFPGLTKDQARMIIGATTLPSKGTAYFFFKDGTYSRYDFAKKRINFGPHPTDKGWSGVKGKKILGVAEFEENNDAVYFFYDDGQYANYKISRRTVTYEGAASGWK